MLNKRLKIEASGRDRNCFTKEAHNARQEAVMSIIPVYQKRKLVTVGGAREGIDEPFRDLLNNLPKAIDGVSIEIDNSVLTYRREQNLDGSQDERQLNIITFEESVEIHSWLANNLF